MMNSENINNNFVERLVESLIFSMNIPDGFALVAIVGTGHEQNNREAMTFWVKQQLLSRDDEHDSQLLITLQQQLFDHIEDICDQHY